MGIATDAPLPPSGPESLAASPRGPTPEQESWPTETCLETDCLLNFAVEEVVRLIEVFHEEVGSVYPLLSSVELAENALGIIRFVRDLSEGAAFDGVSPSKPKVEIRDVQY